MTALTLAAPLAGWALPLADVPDPVFAEGMAGDGVAIDPTGDALYAPCAGEVALLRDARHALTLRTEAGIELLIHVGIDTVALRGEGFTLDVRHGQQVAAGERLLRFDLDVLARRAKSLVTPVLVTGGARVVRRVTGRVVEIGDVLLEVELESAATAPASAAAGEARRTYRVPFDHGLHARPAARLAALLRPFAAEVEVLAKGRSGNARSTVALMALGVHGGERIEVVARGADAGAALAALETLLQAVAHDAPIAAPGVAPHARSSAAAALQSGTLEAVVAARGLALGVAVQFGEDEIAVAETGGGYAAETESLRLALAEVQARLEARAAASSGTQRTILAAHVELSQDPELKRQAGDWLRRGKSAAFAWREAVRATIAAISALGDAHMLERAADLRDLERQVLRALAGEAPATARTLPTDAIVLAGEILPSQLAALDLARVAGICMAGGGPTSHVALLAAAHGVPTLVAAGEAVLAIADGTPLLLDAERGRLAIDPPAAERAALRAEIARRAQGQAEDLAHALRACTSSDGVPVLVHANIGESGEAAAAVARGADGCGLLRTEFLFLQRQEPPDESEQAREYAAIAGAFGARTVTIRTLDVGGDKPIAYLPLPREENPALGQRGLRVSLAQPAFLRTQLRALLRLHPAHAVRILLPMVTELAEVRSVRALLVECAQQLGLRDLPELGAMIETPASAVLADQIVAEVDFVSIGSNDLAQYTLCMDRAHPQLAGRLDGLHPAVLRLIGGVARAAREAGKPVAVCGGLGSDPVAVPVLLGLGVRELSVVPALIPLIKRTVRGLDLRACEALALAALQRPSARAVRELVERSDYLNPRRVPAEVES